MITAKGYNGTVTFDGDTITITRSGFVARAMMGKSDKRIPVRQVTAVQFKQAGKIQRGFIQFTLGGADERRSRLGHQTTDAMQDENSVVFNPKSAAEFDAMRAAIETAIASGGSAPAAGATDRVDQLARLADLHRSGMLTDAEFQQEKARILSQEG